MKKHFCKLTSFLTLIFLISCNSENKQGPSPVNADTSTNNIKIDSVETIKQEKSPRDAEDFEVFLKHFLTKLYFKDNFDRSMYKSSPDFLEFTNKELPLGRFDAPGVYTVCLKAPYFDTDNFLNTKINLKNTEIIEGKLPKDGFCEPSNLKDAIYYKVVKSVPVGYDMTLENLEQYPKILRKLKIIQVEIQVDKMIERIMYFTFYKGKWYFIYVDDSISCGT